MEEENKENIEAIKKLIRFKYLTKEARERLGRVRLVKPTLAEKVENYIISLIQMGKLNRQITDEELKKLLIHFSGE